MSLPSNLQERQNEPAETILPDGLDIPADPTLDGTVKGPILPAMPGVLDEADNYSDDDGPELPELPAAPGVRDETDAPQELQIAPQDLPMVQVEKRVQLKWRLLSTPEEQLDLIQDLKDWDRTFMTHKGLPFSGRESSVVCIAFNYKLNWSCYTSIVHHIKN